MDIIKNCTIHDDIEHYHIKNGSYWIAPNTKRKEIK